MIKLRCTDFRCSGHYKRMSQADANLHLAFYPDHEVEIRK